MLLFVDDGKNDNCSCIYFYDVFYFEFYIMFENAYKGGDDTLNHHLTYTVVNTKICQFREVLCIWGICKDFITGVYMAISHWVYRV